MSALSWTYLGVLGLSLGSSYFIIQDKTLYIVTLVLLVCWCLVTFLSGYLARTALTYLRLGLALLTFVVVIGIPLSERVIEKQQGNYSHVHDGLVCTEHASELLMQGRNIYSEDMGFQSLPGDHKVMRTSGFLTWPFSQRYVYPNPAAYYHVYPPLLTLNILPFHYLSKKIFHFFDLRIVWLFYLLGIVYLIFRLPMGEEWKYLVTALLLWNPFFLKFFLQGRNDVVVFFWMFLSFYLLNQGREALAIFALAVACLMKQTAWLFVPFIYLYLYCLWDLKTVWQFIKKAFTQSLFPLGFVILTTLPFIIWDFKGLWMDLIAFPMGKVAIDFPMNGFSLLAWLVSRGYLPHPQVTYSLSHLQIPLYFLIFLWTYFHLKRRPALYLVLFYNAGALAIFWFLGRYFHDSHIEFIVSIVILGFVFKEASLTCNPRADRLETGPFENR